MKHFHVVRVFSLLPGRRCVFEHRIASSALIANSYMWILFISSISAQASYSIARNSAFTLRRGLSCKSCGFNTGVRDLLPTVLEPFVPRVLRDHSFCNIVEDLERLVHSSSIPLLERTCVCDPAAATDLSALTVLFCLPALWLRRNLLRNDEIELISESPCSDLLRLSSSCTQIRITSAGSSVQLLPRRCLGRDASFSTPERHALPETFTDLENKFQLARITCETCTRIPPHPSPYSCSPSLLGESANTATVGVPSRTGEKILTSKAKISFNTDKNKKDPLTFRFHLRQRTDAPSSVRRRGSSNATARLLM